MRKNQGLLVVTTQLLMAATMVKVAEGTAKDAVKPYKILCGPWRVAKNGQLLKVARETDNADYLEIMKLNMSLANEDWQQLFEAEAEDVDWDKMSKKLQAETRKLFGHFVPMVTSPSGGKGFKNRRRVSKIKNGGKTARRRALNTPQYRGASKRSRQAKHGTKKDRDAGRRDGSKQNKYGAEASHVRPNGGERLQRSRRQLRRNFGNERGKGYTVLETQSRGINSPRHTLRLQRQYRLRMQQRRRHWDSERRHNSGRQRQKIN
ncbi:Trypanosomal VSG domain containing protein [Trypanosoma brucei equiperdum]|uniref:Trypanosomal VSG domain containing protein n=1 Tax=Trypanosoma brucei equiperdum TaxID=630700 RepID=A0A3L6L998_9TRYP|nr:Trypanosomal VSG domain containing protein [Trypanosoma brucei equiperdum]